MVVSVPLSEGLKRIQEVRPQTMNNLRALDSDPHGVILGYASHPLIFRHVLVMLRRVRVINQSHSSHDAPRFRRVRKAFAELSHIPGCRSYRLSSWSFTELTE